MRETCPSCNEPTINAWRKAIASRESPLVCPSCHAKLYPYVRGKGAYSIAGYAMFLGGIFLSAHLLSLIPVILGLAAIIVLDVYASINGKLESVDHARAEAAGRQVGDAVRRVFKKP